MAKGGGTSAPSLPQMTAAPVAPDTTPAPSSAPVKPEAITPEAMNADAAKIDATSGTSEKKRGVIKTAYFDTDRLGESAGQSGTVLKRVLGA